MHFRQNAILIFVLIAFVTACSVPRQRFANLYTQSGAIKGKGGIYKVGNPYKIMGKWYYPKEDYNYSEVGVASWYGKDFHAKYTANGEIYDMNTLTAAHRTLPLPSVVRVTNLANGRSVVLRVNDRGPFAKNRIIDISKRGAQILGFAEQGTTKVKVEILPWESKRLKAQLLGDDVEGIYETYLTDKDRPHENTIEKMSVPKVVYKTEPDVKVGYFVQAGSFNAQESAENLKAQLSAIKNNIAVKPAYINGGKFYRVRIGPYENRTKANDVLQEIKEFGIYNAKVVFE